jgi:hypothetical protein
MSFLKCGKANFAITSLGLLILIYSIAPAATAQIFSQDLTMHSTTTGSGMGGRGASSTTATDYFSKNAMKTSSSDGLDTIIRFDSEKIISIDNKKKTYSEMTFKQLQELISSMGTEMGANRQEMESLRKMMGQVAADFTVEKAGPGETVAGYPTEKYLVKGPMEMEIHAATTLKIPAAYYDIMKIQMPSNPMLDMKKLYDEMKKIDGIPLKTVTSMKMMNMETKTSKAVTSIEKGAIPASIFEIPAGYKQVNSRFQ